MDINQMVFKYLPLLQSAQRNESYKDHKHIFEMFRTGKYGILDRDYISTSGTGSFQNPGVVIDGGRLKTEPWRVFQEVEQKIGLEPYFTDKHFTKREDGFYCVLPGSVWSEQDLNLVGILDPISNSSWVECMPSTKGGKSFSDSARYELNETTRDKLEDFYNESLHYLQKNFNITFASISAT